MIAPMTKYSFLVYHKEYDAFLEQLRQLGVVHLIEKQEDVSDAIFEKFEQIKKVNAVARFLTKRLKDDQSQAETLIGGKEAFLEVERLQQELENKMQQLAILRKEISYASLWGDFSPKIIETIRAQGIQVKFYSVSSRKFDNSWLQTHPLALVNQQAGLFYLVGFFRNGEKEDLGLEEMRIPERPVSELLYYESNIKAEIAHIEATFDSIAVQHNNAINYYAQTLVEETQLARAVHNTVREADEKVMLLEGWAPDSAKKGLEEFLENSRTLFVEQKPHPEEKVPILLRNKSFSKKFEPLVGIYSLPKYNELDLTPFFAPFYMIFFGFCLGDVGYGVLMVLAALLLKKKVAKEMKQILGLVFYLGLSTIFFGIISGTAFGIALYETGLPVYRTLAAEFQARGTDISQLLFYLALILGGVQILFGMVLKVVNEVKQFGWGFALGSIGWFALLIGLIGLRGFSMISGIPMEQLSTPLYIILGVTGILILPLNNLGRNPLINTGAGLWNAYSMITGFVGDLLSYIRLFALSLSSAILGFVFNSMAVEMSGTVPVLSAIVMIIILVFGHGINLFMSGLGAFVHPMRLTFVEFYKHAGFTGGGEKYEPFKKLT